MTMKTSALAAIATVLPTASAFAHAGSHSHGEASISHFVSSAFHMSLPLVALVAGFALYRLTANWLRD